MKKKTKQGNHGITVSCGDCEGLSRRALHPVGDDGKAAKVCSQTGTLPETKPCARFRPDVFSLDTDARVALRQLSNLIKKFDPRDLRIVAATLMNEHKTRTHGLRFGQRMFVRYRSYVGRDYTSNFMACTVMDAGDGVVRLMSSDGQTALTFDLPASGSFDGPVLYDAPSFRPLLKKMKRDKKFFDPQNETSRRLAPEEPVTYKVRKEELGAVILDIEDVLRSKPKRKRGAQGDRNLVDLRDMVDKLERGEFLGRVGDEFTDDDVQVLGDSAYRKGKKKKRPARRSSGELELSSLV